MFITCKTLGRGRTLGVSDRIGRERLVGSVVAQKSCTLRRRIRCILARLHNDVFIFSIFNFMLLNLYTYSHSESRSVVPTLRKARSVGQLAEFPQLHLEKFIVMCM